AAEQASDGGRRQTLLLKPLPEDRFLLIRRGGGCRRGRSRFRIGGSGTRLGRQLRRRGSGLLEQPVQLLHEVGWPLRPDGWFERLQRRNESGRVLALGA